MHTSARIKLKFWKWIYPIFPYLQYPFSFFHSGRQKFPLGWLAPGKSLEDLKARLTSQGFGNHFVAWEDDGQVLSWRKFDGFEWQYHVRVFADGEIRGHYERTPEAAPLRHFAEIGEEARAEDFKKFLGDVLTAEKHITHLKPDAAAKNIQTQITFS
ncbi:MAG: hypothetical protein RIQ56_24 [Candidatus Parcubacteria bacterium]|jgi:hypothetical protein